MKRTILLVCGTLALVLGAIGLFLPVLPTTPFVLLAAMCFSYSSDPMYQRLIKSKQFGPYIENYRTNSGVPLRLKVKSITSLWLLLILSAIFIPLLYVRIILIVVGICVTIHLVSIKTRKE